MDSQPPNFIFCPKNIEESIELGNSHKRVKWEEPLAADASNKVRISSQTHYTDDYFIVGKTEVTYTFVDESANAVNCTFMVKLIEGNCALFMF